MHMHDTLTPDDYCRDAIGHGCYARDLDGVVQAFVPSVRDRLIERGVLTQRADGCWYLLWHGFDLDREQAADMGCCDFCSARPVTWCIPCVSFTLPEMPGLPVGVSQGDWAACEPCGSFIAAATPTAKANLLIRALAAKGDSVLPVPDATVPGLSKALRDLKKRLHVRFWRHYQGGAVPIPPHPYGH